MEVYDFGTRTQLLVRHNTSLSTFEVTRAGRRGIGYCVGFKPLTYVNSSMFYRTSALFHECPWAEHT